MKTRGEIEAAICDGVNRFEQDYMGRGGQGHSRPPAWWSAGGPPQGPPDGGRATPGQVAAGRKAERCA